MSGLSKNVMNMKFMQKSGRNNDGELSTEKTRKVRDSSEWELPTKVQIQKTLKPAIKVSSIGYGSIASLTQQSEEEEKPHKQQKKAEASLSTSAASKNETGDEAKKFLQDILGDSTKRNKRTKKDTSSKKQKNISPKNKRFKAE